MKKRPLSPFGVQIKMKLMLLNQTQEWLNQEVSKDTGLYVYSSLMYRILTGTVKNPKLVSSIGKILNIDYDEPKQ